MLAEQAIDQASIKGARIICFPECSIPGYRAIGKPVPPPDPELLDHAWPVIAEAAAKANITGSLGPERFVEGPGPGPDRPACSRPTCGCPDPGCASGEAARSGRPRRHRIGRGRLLWRRRS